jgi:hypothetical protein
MAAVLDRLAEAPKTGLPYRMIRNRQIRRILMARTSYNVYFEVQEERALVRIVAVSHAVVSRKPSPPFTLPRGGSSSSLERQTVGQAVPLSFANPARALTS